MIEKVPTGDQPGTGDDSGLLLWCMVWALCVAALCVLLLAKKKKLFID